MWWMAPVLTSLVACDPPGEPDSCATALDGRCDELATCALGTDSSDCEAACDEEPWPAEAVGACAHRVATAPAPSIDPDVGTDGQGGPVGTWDGIVLVDGAQPDTEVERHYRVFVPDGYDPAVPTPLIFVLGGFRTDLYFLADYTEMDRTADLNRFIVVYGEGELIFYGSYWAHTWYVYDQDFDGSWKKCPDLDYFETILEELGDLYNIDRTRVFVAGHSRGGAISIIAAFERPDLFAGFVSQAGFVEPNGYDARLLDRAEGIDRRFNAVLVHGKDDPDVPVSNSNGIRDLLEEAGWTEGETYEYYHLDNVGHEWQPQYNQQIWDFLRDNPLPLEEVGW